VANYDLKGFLLKVRDSQNVTVDIGTLQGLKPGDPLIIYKQGETLVHPVTGKVLGTEEVVLGHVVTTRTTPEISFGKVVDAQELPHPWIPRRRRELLMGPLVAILLAGAVESFQVAAYNETQVEGRKLVYDETDVWMQKSWATFDRSTNTFYAGVESLVEPADQGSVRRYGMDVASAIVGFKHKTYLPDWYSLNVRLRVPVMTPRDPFGAPRSWDDRLQLRLDPVIVQKSWNLFTVYDRNRVTLTPQYLEYGNKLKLIETTPDLDFPIAMYAGLDLRLRKGFDGSGFVRGDG